MDCDYSDSSSEEDEYSIQHSFGELKYPWQTKDPRDELKDIVRFQSLVIEIPPDNNVGIVQSESELLMIIPGELIKIVEFYQIPQYNNDILNKHVRSLLGFEFVGVHKKECKQIHGDKKCTLCNVMNRNCMFCVFCGAVGCDDFVKIFHWSPFGIRKFSACRKCYLMSNSFEKIEKNHQLNYVWNGQSCEEYDTFYAYFKRDYNIPYGSTETCVEQVENTSSRKHAECLLKGERNCDICHHYDANRFDSGNYYCDHCWDFHSRFVQYHNEEKSIMSYLDGHETTGKLSECRLCSLKYYKNDCQLCGKDCDEYVEIVHWMPHKSFKYEKFRVCLDCECCREFELDPKISYVDFVEESEEPNLIISHGDLATIDEETSFEDI